MVDGLSRWGVAPPQRLLFFHGIELVPWLFPAGVYVTAKALPEGFSRFPWASHALRGRSAASAAGPLQFFSWLSPVATGPNAAGRVSRLREHRAPRGLALTQEPCGITLRRLFKERAKKAEGQVQAERG